MRFNNRQGRQQTDAYQSDRIRLPRRPPNNHVEYSLNRLSDVLVVYFVVVEVMQAVKSYSYFGGIISFPAVDEGVRLLGLSLCWMQIFDGFLTWLGISRYGIGFEGNPFLHNLMLNFGAVPTLIGTKLFAIIAVIFVCVFSQNAKWVKSGLIVTNAIYLILAVIPWIITLS